MATRYVTDEKGERVAVQIDLKEYENLLEQSELLQDIAEYERVKASDDETIPFDQALAEIERDRAQRSS